MSFPNSYLFVPATSPDRFVKAASSGAHRIIIDLEDAVAPAEKATARENVADWFRQGGAGLVRVNGTDSQWFVDDLAALKDFHSVELMIPKASVRSLQDVDEHMPGQQVLALVETVEGIVQIQDLACFSTVSRLAFGNLDFAFDAGVSASSAIIDHARIQMALASRYSGLPAPVDGVTVDFSDEENLTNDVVHARNLGFSGKLCIHPRQIGLVNRGFQPTDDELEWARKIDHAARLAGGSVIQVGGKMVDKPVIDRARAILAAARQAPAVD
ncbi:CoA ester lyase [Agrobacterium tumefaciens]|uniref:HpcH/HpaI aldolase/citrate lyase family protein n=1 Tax=Agrobacterium tumefaciens TaxID=358 RepID=UPI001573C839|nr:CoA ester lyase [Agrobacterium tumefaciens]NTB94914.1 CoA ester lyase [Agrobacterium tumefaciens]NTC44035.1 CoA ester lyase [Agrobacterium tumefaciens]